MELEVVVLCARMVSERRDMGVKTRDVRGGKGREQINELSCASRIKISEGRISIGTSAGGRIDTCAGFVCSCVKSELQGCPSRSKVGEDPFDGWPASVVASGKEMQAARVRPYASASMCA
jgi:hypothetical protein